MAGTGIHPTVTKPAQSGGTENIACKTGTGATNAVLWLLDSMWSSHGHSTHGAETWELDNKRGLI